MTDREILRMWREKRGPIHLQQDFDPDISFPCIKGIEFELNDKNESYIASVTLPDPHGRSFIKASPKRLYTGELRKKYTDNFS